MVKIDKLLILMPLAFFSAAQSVSFNCKYNKSIWNTVLGSIYWCNVQNLVSITSNDRADIDDITGTHTIGHSYHNVEGFYISNLGQTHYFPRGLNNFFKYIKGILITGTGLKEIHQNDLKVFPKLKDLHLHSSNLEVLEKDLFEFNPNLELISLNSNKISHIDPNVFDKLRKLKYLYLQSNLCISMAAVSGSTQVQNVINVAKDKCTNSEFADLEQKVKSLEVELNLVKLDSLDSEVKNSKFANFFKDKVQVLNDRKEIATSTEGPKKMQNINFETSSAISFKVDHISATMNGLMIRSKSFEDKVEDIIQKASTFSQDTTTTLNNIESSNNQNFAAIVTLIEEFGKKMEAIEAKLAGIDSVQVKLMNKIHKMESKNHDNKLEINQRLKAILNAV